MIESWIDVYLNWFILLALADFYYLKNRLKQGMKVFNLVKLINDFNVYLNFRP